VVTFVTYMKKSAQQINCDCDVDELLRLPIFPDISNASYIPYGKGGLVFCAKHIGWVGFEWVAATSTRSDGK
jgi:hypothetical protein